MWSLFGGLLLATIAAAQDGSGSSCTERTYTTQIGLKFNTKCNVNAAISDIANSVMQDLNACMTACSTRGSDENTDPCEAVAWNVADSRCWMKGRGVTPDNTTTAVGTIMAFSDPTVWENLESGCGYDNNTVITDTNGQQFEVLCDTRYKGDNYDPNIRPDYPEKHTDTLEECLEYCSAGSPLCYGVLFSATMESGYRNCYPKTKNATQNKNSWVEQTNMITAYAYSAVNTTCAGSSYTASNGAVFNTSCDHSGDSPDLERVHSDSFEHCQDECATYKPASGNAACQGVVYQPNALDGWLNCYLKYGLTNVTSQSEWHLAILDTTASGTSPTSSSSSKAWIAGPVVGVIVLIAIIAGVLLWRRRRRARGTYQHHSSQERVESEPFKQQYPMQDQYSQQGAGGGSPYMSPSPGSGTGVPMKYDYASSTHRHPPVGPAEMDTASAREAAELPSGRELRHEMQG